MKFPVTTLPEFWNNIVRSSASIQMMKKVLGESLWRKKKSSRWLGWKRHCRR
ncbi:MAG: hypothetical protein K2P67_00200 [Gallionellaceae bacterium]|jgi:hypothetical protein|nr:hypothetical protein [Gallionellaceae bacterium]